MKYRFFKEHSDSNPECIYCVLSEKIQTVTDYEVSDLPWKKFKDSKEEPTLTIKTNDARQYVENFISEQNGVSLRLDVNGGEDIQIRKVPFLNDLINEILFESTLERGKDYELNCGTVEVAAYEDGGYHCDVVLTASEKSRFIPEYVEITDFNIVSNFLNILHDVDVNRLPVTIYGYSVEFPLELWADYVVKKL